MIKTSWYTLIPLKYDLDKLVAWAQEIQCQTEPWDTIGAVSNKQRFWMTSLVPEVWQQCNEIMPCIDYWSEHRMGGSLGPRNCSIWEYPEYDELLPHIDNDEGVGGYPGKTSLIIPLIGDFTTWYFTDDTCTEKADQVTYSPGSIFVMKNWDRYHGGEPCGDYRLCLHVFSQTDIDDYLDVLFD